MNRERISKILLAGIIITFSISLFIYSSADADEGDTTRVSVDSSGAEAIGGRSAAVSISSDGRYIVFESDATNLVDDDTNGVRDIFVHDTQSGATTRVSFHSDGSEGNENSYEPVISADGRYVAFSSLADTLVDGDTNDKDDVFLHDTQTDTTTRISIHSDGSESNDFSGPNERIDISSNGRYVVFSSLATNLIGGGTNGSRHIFLRDTQDGTTTFVSVDSSETEGDDDSSDPSISSDGRYVAFWSEATNLVGGDNNGASDIFLRDNQGGTTTRVSVDTLGNDSDDDSKFPSISSDGRYIAFESEASDLVAGDINSLSDIFVRDTQAGTTTRVSVDSSETESTGGGSFFPSMSDDGIYVSFESDATNLVTGDINGLRDVFLHDTQTGETALISVDSAGAQSTGNSSRASVSSDGRYVAFESTAIDLVAIDTNGFIDVFLHDFFGEDDDGRDGDGGDGSSSGGTGYNCFIATAAYGSHMAPDVKLLRRFRDDYLLTNYLGKAFVKFYYSYSPPVADFITEHESLRMATRLALTPLVYSVKHPGIAVITLVGLVMIPLIRRRSETGEDI